MDQILINEIISCCFIFGQMIIVIQFNMQQNCSFCHEPCIIHCMNRSLHHKHNEQQDKSGDIINELLLKAKTSSFIKYVETIIQSDRRQYMIEYTSGEPSIMQLQHLKQYYKFRIYVPLFVKSRPSESVLAYYYEKLKHYYNNIKRKLHITIDPSSSSEVSSLTQTDLSTKEELLKDIKRQIQLEKKKKIMPNLINYKSQSKALEQLVSYLKLNSRFEQIKTLKTQDCFDEQHIFEQLTSKRVNQKITFNEATKSSIKTRLFKKVIDNSTGRKTPIQNDSNRERPTSRSKSIKMLKCKDYKQATIQTDRNLKLNSPFRIKQQYILKESRQSNSLGKRHSSLGRLNQNHYSAPASPYKKKCLTKEKPKTNSTNSITAKLKHQSNDPSRIKNQQKTKIKDSIAKIQIIKFQNEVLKNRTTPNSPSSKKIIKQNVQVVKNDNILSIRKKKLQILKQKVHKK